MSSSNRNLDLHTLECFDLFVREASVTRAAERLDISQSSASEALARLRERFGDPLLVRTRDGMVPTPRALELLPQIRAALDQLRRLLGDTTKFDAATSRERFRITTSDYVQLLLMPGLAQRVTEQAPHCTVDLVPVHIQRAEAALEASEVDLMIAYHPDPPAGLRRSPLFTDDLVCLARRGHPQAGRALDAQRFARLPHVGVAPSGLNFFSGIVDAALAAHGMQRRIAFSSPHFMLGAHLVARSDMVLALPRRAALELAGFLPLEILEIPMAMQSIDVAMYWHERTHAATGHQWLRELVREVLMGASDD